jgi:hypothetical protein
VLTNFLKLRLKAQERTPLRLLLGIFPVALLTMMDIRRGFLVATNQSSHASDSVPTIIHPSAAINYPSATGSIIVGITVAGLVSQCLSRTNT